jgi:hypothetical protein
LGNRFVLLIAGEPPAGLETDPDLSIVCIGAKHGPGGAIIADDVEGLVQQRYALAPGSAYLIRPDQYVCALVPRTPRRSGRPEARTGLLEDAA